MSHHSCSAAHSTCIALSFRETLCCTSSDWPLWLQEGCAIGVGRWAVPSCRITPVSNAHAPSKYSRPCNLHLSSRVHAEAECRASNFTASIKLKVLPESIPQPGAIMCLPPPVDQQTLSIGCLVLPPRLLVWSDICLQVCYEKLVINGFWLGCDHIIANVVTKYSRPGRSSISCYTTAQSQTFPIQPCQASYRTHCDRWCM